MQDIRIDSEGNQRCWKCGGKNCFTLKRTFRSKMLIGVGALLTAKKLKCQLCGEYNQVGGAKPFTTAADERLAKKLGTIGAEQATDEPKNTALSAGEDIVRRLLGRR